MDTEKMRSTRKVCLILTVSGTKATYMFTFPALASRQPDFKNIHGVI